MLKEADGISGVGGPCSAPGKAKYTVDDVGVNAINSTPILYLT